jgi:hypothetical protein
MLCSCDSSAPGQIVNLGLTDPQACGSLCDVHKVTGRLVALDLHPQHSNPAGRVRYTPVGADAFYAASNFRHPASVLPISYQGRK